MLIEPEYARAVHILSYGSAGGKVSNMVKCSLLSFYVQVVGLTDCKNKLLLHQNPNLVCFVKH